ncbi:MAG: hypothetical protein R3B40_20320 [Polyangiales bacterium]|nr:hypothetical protein [Sandaracinaceae bacterium]
MNAPAQPPALREIPFNALPEATRRRLTDALGKRGASLPIYENVQGKGGVVGFAVLALLFGLALLLALAVEFGSGSSFTQGPEFIGVYAALVFLFVVSALASVGRALLLRAVPFRPGVYLFATDLVDATGPVLRIHPVGAMTNMKCVHHHTNGVYTNSLTTLHFGRKNYTFAVRGKQLAEGKLRELNTQRQAVVAAAREGAIDRLRALDVFFEARVLPVWNDPAAVPSALRDAGGTPLAGDVPKVFSRKALLSLGLAVISAVPLWFVRNQLSDEAAYRTIRNYYHASNYVNRGGNHAATVRADLLPRMALERAQQRGTVTALREFMAEFGGSPYGQAGRDAIHAHFERVKQAFLAQANTQDAQMVSFMSALLAWLEANGSPPVAVHYAPPGAGALLEVDRVLAASAGRVTGRPIAPIAPHFAPEYAASREQSVTRALQAGFGAVFPGEILELHGVHGPETLAAAAGVPSQAPSIHVAYNVRPSGATYSSDHDSADFVGIQVDFVVTMSVPGQAPYTFMVGVEPPEHFSIRRSNEPVVVPGGTAGLVYAEMARRAFDRLGASMAQTFFRPDSAAFRSATQGAGQ